MSVCVCVCVTNITINNLAQLAAASVAQLVEDLSSVQSVVGLSPT